MFLLWNLEKERTALQIIYKGIWMWLSELTYLIKNYYINCGVWKIYTITIDVFCLSLSNYVRCSKNSRSSKRTEWTFACQKTIFIKSNILPSNKETRDLIIWNSKSNDLLWKTFIYNKSLIIPFFFESKITNILCATNICRK